MTGAGARHYPRMSSSPTTLAALLCLLVSAASAGWIDPDTPEDAYETWALPARPPPALPHSRNKAGVSSPNCTVGAHGAKCTLHNATNTTNATSSADNATSSPAPTTAEPTAAPTEAPIPRRYELVMSDEFNSPGRTFGDGTDPRWTALHKNDYTNDALHYYSSDNARTNSEGELVIETEAADTDVIGYDDVKREKAHVTKHFRSAMLQTWNKFCFTGGVVEAEVVMPGKHNVGGLWPAFWLLGNLARHTYVGSSEHIWPWSVTECTPKSRDSQKISGCAKAIHYGIIPGTGRGAPEIDIFEVQPGDIKANTGKFHLSPIGQPFMSSSYQVAPGIPYNRPGPGWWPGPGQWYDGLVGGNGSAMNILFYGAYNHFQGDTDPARQDYWSDAISFNRQLERRHFRRKHKYRLEWDVPDKERGTDGYLHWFLDGELVLKLNGTSIVNAGMGTEISSEPSYILMNTAVSSQWGFPSKCPINCPCKKYNCNVNDWTQKCGFTPGFCEMLRNDTAKYKINYVRVYQDPDDPKQKVGCSTPERPTRRWIDAHTDQYKEEDDRRPLNRVRNGGGACVPGATGRTADACGGTERGTCVAKKRRRSKCACNEGWTGPNCLAHAGFDDVVWDEAEGIAAVGFSAPRVPLALAIGFAALALLLIITTAVAWTKSDRGYVPVPDAPPGPSGEFA